MTESAAALTLIMQLPDPPEMKYRGHRRTCDGKPDVQLWWHQNLPRIYVQHMRPALNDEPKRVN